MKMENNLMSKESIEHVLSKYHVSESEMPKFTLEARLAQIDELFSGTTLESVFNKLRKDGDDFSKRQLNTMSKMVSNNR